MTRRHTDQVLCVIQWSLVLRSTLLPLSLGSLNQEQKRIVVDKIDPKELVQQMDDAEKAKEEARRRLAPFREAGWSYNSIAPYCHRDERSKGGFYVAAYFEVEKNKIHLHFSPPSNDFYFATAKEALDCVAAVDKEVADRKEE